MTDFKDPLGGYPLGKDIDITGEQPTVPETAKTPAAPDGAEADQPEPSFPSYEDFKEIVAELLDELPEAFFTELSGGVLVEDHIEASDYAVADDLYTLGVYRVNNLGRQVVIYYGSFAHLFPYLRGDALKERIRETVRHEFRHHMEFLAGIHGSTSLEAEDERQMRRYLAGHQED